MTGEDQEVIDYVLQSPVSKSFIRRYLNLLKISHTILHCRGQDQSGDFIGAVPEGSIAQWFWPIILPNSLEKLGITQWSGIEM
jgi:hypothetical protein